MTHSLSALLARAQSLPLPRRIALASAIAGLLVAALVLMTPNLLFERFIVATGLPGAIEAAAPPLGAKARIVFAFFAALATVIPVAAILFVALTRKSGRPARAVDPEDEFFATMPTPRRRADSHPDAPPRAPIKAGDDLGTPLDLVDVVTGDRDAADEDDPRPRWADDAAEFSDDIRAADPATGEEDRDLDPAADWPPARKEFREATAADAVETAAEAPADAAGAEAAGAPADAAEAGADAGAATNSIPAPSVDEDEKFPFAARSQGDTGEAADMPGAAALDGRDTEARPSAVGPDDLMALIERLEAGIARRRRRAESANDRAQQPANVAPHPVADPARDGELQGALREALDALHKLNASNG